MTLRSLTMQLATIMTLAVVATACTSSNTMPTATTASPSPVVENSPTTETSPMPAKMITATELAAHKTKADCWLAIDGKVYDVTEFIPSHPGGEAIVQGCGKDASSFFHQRPGVGTDHPADAQAMLPQFYLGELKTE